MKPAPFAYHRARDVAHAVSLLAETASEGGRVLAGGQSLVPLMAFRLAQPAHLIDINRVADMGALSVADGMLRVPATVRHAEFEALDGPGPLGPLLGDVARHIAHAPIRVRGTFCGSLAHADPSAEWPLVFATLGGEAVARSVRGERVIAATDWFRGIMSTALADDELLIEARLPLLPQDARAGFREISRRAGDYAMAMALVVFRIEDGAIAEPRIGIGGAERVPRRIATAEAALTGAPTTEEAFRAAAAIAAAAITPMEDVQVSAALRRDLVRAMVHRALRGAIS